MIENIVNVAAARTAVDPFGGSPGPTDKMRRGGLKPVHLAMQVAAGGDAQVIIDGGRGGMNRSAHVQPRSRDGQRMGHWPLVDTTIVGGFRDVFNRIHRGVTDENIAKHDGFSREELDTDGADFTRCRSAMPSRGSPHSVSAMPKAWPWQWNVVDRR